MKIASRRHSVQKLIALRSTPIKVFSQNLVAEPQVNHFALVQRNFDMNRSFMQSTQKRSFFKRSKDENKEDVKEESKDEQKEQPEVKEETSEKEPEVDAKEEKESVKTDSKEEDKAAEQSESSSEEELTSADIKKIKALITEQDETIEAHAKTIEELQTDIKKWKQKYAYQIAENDNTVKRYRKQIEDGKLFAISKFAKELLDVRDNLDLALQHANLDKVDEMEEIEQLKVQFKSVVNGQEMTTRVMDKVLGKFEVKNMDPLGEKFDPNHHDAMMMIPESEEYPDNHVAMVVQTGWTIGDRVLRAAKVGIAKKQ